MALSEDGIAKYLKFPSACPYCKSGLIEAGATEVEQDDILQLVFCLNCKREWHDRYTLHGIVEDDAGHDGLSDADLQQEALRKAETGIDFDDVEFPKNQKLDRSEDDGCFIPALIWVRYDDARENKQRLLGEFAVAKATTDTDNVW